MDEIIEKQVNKVSEAISGFSWSDQYFILQEIADRLKVRSTDCLAIEYGIMEE
jgi:hypothetical protein